MAMKHWNLQNADVFLGARCLEVSFNVLSTNCGEEASFGFRLNSDEHVLSVL